MKCWPTILLLLHLAAHGCARRRGGSVSGRQDPSAKRPVRGSRGRTQTTRGTKSRSRPARHRIEPGLRSNGPAGKNSPKPWKPPPKPQPSCPICWPGSRKFIFSKAAMPRPRQTAERVLKLDGQHPLAHLVLAEAITETGRLDEALENYVWFVQFYNRVQPTDAETLGLVANGSLQYARWKGSSQDPQVCHQHLMPRCAQSGRDLLAGPPDRGRLAFGKIQPRPGPARTPPGTGHQSAGCGCIGFARAMPPIKSTIWKKPTTYADQALKINPHHIAACWLKADLYYHGRPILQGPGNHRNRSGGQSARAKNPRPPGRDISSE